MQTQAASPSSALRVPANRVSPRALRFWQVHAGVRWGLIIAVQLGWLAYGVVWSPPLSSWHVPLLAASIVIGALHVGVMPPWRYWVHRWEVTEHAVYTQTGWLHQERRIAPISRVQTVDTEQGALARLFRLAKVTVTTASAAGPLVIAGLDADVAAELVERLTAATEAERGDAT
jgi:membrane protein YdbS with pleckstrin-like domain